jgi:hypothetical protein
MSKYEEEDQVGCSDGSLSEESNTKSDTAQGAEEDRTSTHEVTDRRIYPGGEQPLCSSWSDSSSDEEGDENEDEEHDSGHNAKDFFQDYDEQNLGRNSLPSHDYGSDIEATGGSDQVPFSPNTLDRLDEERKRGYDYHDRPRRTHRWDGDFGITLQLQPNDVHHPLHECHRPASRGPSGSPERQKRIGEDTLPEMPYLPKRWSRLGQREPASDERQRIVEDLLKKQASKPKSELQTNPDQCDEDDYDENSPDRELEPPSYERPSSIPHIRKEDPTSPGSPKTDGKDCFEGPPDSSGNLTAIPWDEAVKLTTQPRNWADEDVEDDWLGASSSEQSADLVDDVVKHRRASAGAFEGPVGLGLLGTVEAEQGSPDESAVPPLEHPESPIVLRFGAAEQGSLNQVRRERTPVTDPAHPQDELDKPRLTLVEEVRSELAICKADLKAGQKYYDRLKYDHARLLEELDGLCIDRHELSGELLSVRQRHEEDQKTALAHMKAQGETIIAQREEIEDLETKLEEEEKKSRRAEQKFQQWKKFAEDLEPLAEAERVRQENNSTDAAMLAEPEVAAASIAKSAHVKCVNCEALHDERDIFAEDAECLRSEVGRLQEALDQAARVGFQLAQQVRQLEAKPVLRNVFHGMSDSPEPTPALPPTPTLPIATSANNGKPAWQVRMDKWRKSPEFIAKCAALEVRKKARVHQRWQERENERLDKKLKLDVYTLVTGKQYQYMPQGERNLLLGRIQTELTA